MIGQPEPAGVHSVTFRETVIPDNVSLKPQHYTLMTFKVGGHGPFTRYYPTISFDPIAARKDADAFAAKLAAAGGHGLT